MQSNNKKRSVPKLEVFETIRPLMVRLGLHSYNLTEPKNEFFRTFVAYHTMAVSVLLFIISSIIYIYQNVTDFSAVPEPLVLICAGIHLLGTFTCLGLSKRNVKLLQIELQELIDKSNYLHFSFDFLKYFPQSFYQLKTWVFLIFTGIPNKNVDSTQTMCFITSGCIRSCLVDRFYTHSIPCTSETPIQRHG